MSRRGTATCEAAATGVMPITEVAPLSSTTATTPMATVTADTRMGITAVTTVAVMGRALSSAVDGTVEVITAAATTVVADMGTVATGTAEAAVIPHRTGPRLAVDITAATDLC